MEMEMGDGDGHGYSMSIPLVVDATPLSDVVGHFPSLAKTCVVVRGI